MSTRVILNEAWIRGGESYAAGAVLSLPDIEAFNLVAAGKAEAVEAEERESRVLSAPRVGATVGRPNTIRRVTKSG